MEKINFKKKFGYDSINSDIYFCFNFIDYFHPILSSLSLVYLNVPMLRNRNFLDNITTAIVISQLRLLLKSTGGGHLLHSH